MPSKSRTTPSGRDAGDRGAGRTSKVPKTYRLSEAKIEAARQILGVRTATEAIETALDLVVFRQELVDGTRALFGLELRGADVD
jgi:hypothetical protein